MESLYALYDALVSIDIPADRARAVVDALERDMLGQLVTKTEFHAEMRLLRQEIAATRELLSKDIHHQATVMTVRLGTISVGTVGLAVTLLELVRYLN